MTKVMCAISDEAFSYNLALPIGKYEPMAVAPFFRNQVTCRSQFSEITFADKDGESAETIESIRYRPAICIANPSKSPNEGCCRANENTLFPLDGR